MSKVNWRQQRRRGNKIICSNIHLANIRFILLNCLFVCLSLVQTFSLLTLSLWNFNEQRWWKHFSNLFVTLLKSFVCDKIPCNYSFYYSILVVIWCKKKATDFYWTEAGQFYQWLTCLSKTVHFVEKLFQVLMAIWLKCSELFFFFI